MPPSKTKKPRTIAVKRAVPSARTAIARRAAFHIFFATVFAGLLLACFYFTRGFVERYVAFPNDPPRIVLKNRPVWMSDLLAEEIVRTARPVGAHSAFDHQLLVDIDRILRASPWIGHVKQIRRAYQNQPGDTIEVDCDYRAPVALVQWKDYFWLVDGEGVKLPAQFRLDQLPNIVFGTDKKVNIRVIQGVHNPPVESGQRWQGDDLTAGLDLVKLLYDVPYAEEIVQVDVSNFAGRVSAKEAHLTLGTRYDSTIRWGKPVHAGADSFVEVSPQKKLEYLKQIRAQFGRVDAGHPWIDIRFDKPTYPSDSPMASAP